MDTSQTVKLRCAGGKVVQPLPNVCIACGRPAVQIRQWTASNMPLWATFLSPHSLGTKQVSIQMPLCEEHGRARDRVRTISSLGGISLGMVVALLAGVLLSEKLSGLLYEVLGPLILLIIPLMVALPVGYTVVVTMAASALPRVQRIDESSITLKGVSDKFRRAVMEAEGA